MRTFPILLSTVALAAMLSGCATPLPTGAIYTGVTMPSAATAELSTDKKGTAQCISVLGLVAVGDCSIDTAVRDGGITKISHVDFRAKNILGVYGQYTTTVYGE
ncbi:TRL-like family protein [Desulfocurvibacter africanus]|uniref:TRL-like family protein n=1 Tax=Desulfocurvibacter africanus TaxID=873 RepID=UPI00041F9EC1|nr:TRL-like family protein [Desulfocurvibacter africanus]